MGSVYEISTGEVLKDDESDKLITLRIPSLELKLLPTSEKATELILKVKLPEKMDPGSSHQINVVEHMNREFKVTR